MSKNTAAGMSDALMGLLAQADQQRGFPQGTMYSVMQQETGGKPQYLADPSTYHYGLNAEGKRIAGHTGKVSTAFGPFGILESTGRDPGFGVKPLQNKSLEEQVRFASEYLAARSKGAGGLEAGLAGYGEGGKYGQQVMARLGNNKGAGPVVAERLQNAHIGGVQAGPAIPLQVLASADLPAERVVNPAALISLPEVPLYSEKPAATAQWDQLQGSMPAAFHPGTMAYGNQAAPVQVANNQPNFSRFKSWLGKA